MPITVQQHFDSWKLAYGHLLEEDVFGAIYRGQSDMSWGLVPSLYRSLGRSGQSIKENEEVLQFFSAEILPNCANIIKKYENSIGSDEDFCKTGGIFYRIAWLQHFGIPTPALDWTSSLLAAFFFAITGQKSTPPGGDRSIRIFRMNRNLVDQSVVEILPLHHIAPKSRLAEQNGLISLFMDGDQISPTSFSADCGIDGITSITISLTPLEQHDLWTYLISNGVGFARYFPEEILSNLHDLSFERFSRFLIGL